VAPLVDRVKASVVTIQSTKVIPRVVNEDPTMQYFRERFGLGQAPSRRETQRGLGSGFVVNKSGVILTNNHVVAGADEVWVQLSDERRFEARVVGSDPSTDVAVVKLTRPPGDLRPVQIGNSEQVRVGDYVLAIGNPLGLGQTVTMGIVSAKNRMLGGRITQYEDFIQTDAAINQGNSGGPLFNFKGEVIGINSAILNPAVAMNIGFAIPINLARQIAEQIQRSGKVARGYLGVGTEDMNPDKAARLGIPFEAGALVNVVNPGSPAAAAGLRSNDIITEVAGRRIENSAGLQQVVQSRAPRETVDVVYLRGGKRAVAKVQLEENPALAGLHMCLACNLQCRSRNPRPPNRGGRHEGRQHRPPQSGERLPAARRRHHPRRCRPAGQGGDHGPAQTLEQRLARGCRRPTGLRPRRLPARPDVALAALGLAGLKQRRVAHEEGDGLGHEVEVGIELAADALGDGDGDIDDGEGGRHADAMPAQKAEHVEQQLARMNLGHAFGPRCAP
jgi:Do/DeqQ family serine protease